MALQYPLYLQDGKELYAGKCYINITYLNRFWFKVLFVRYCLIYSPSLVFLVIQCPVKINTTHSRLFSTWHFDLYHKPYGDESNLGNETAKATQPNYTACAVLLVVYYTKVLFVALPAYLHSCGQLCVKAFVNNTFDWECVSIFCHQ